MVDLFGNNNLTTTTAQQADGEAYLIQSKNELGRLILKFDFCFYCGSLTKSYDHFPPRTSSNIGFLLPCCLQCNSIVKDKYPFELEARIGYLKIRLKEYYGYNENERIENLKESNIYGKFELFIKNERKNGNVKSVKEIYKEFVKQQKFDKIDRIEKFDIMTISHKRIFWNPYEKFKPYGMIISVKARKIAEKLKIRLISDMKKDVKKDPFDKKHLLNISYESFYLNHLGNMLLSGKINVEQIENFLSFQRRNLF